MKIAMISPIAWRTPPRHYGPWEQVTSLLTEGLVKEGLNVTLFATADSITSAKLVSVVPTGYEEDKEADPKVLEYLHISNVFEMADEFDIIHNQFDFMPLCYSRLTKTPMVTTIHGFSSEKILPIYKKYNKHVSYVSISNSDRYPSLDYISTIYHGIDINNFPFNPDPRDYLLFFGRMHPDKGAHDAIKIAKFFKMKLFLAGPIQDEAYFKENIQPHLSEDIKYLGSVGPEKRGELLSNAICLLHPIYFNEPFGLSVIESLACGTPVLAYNRGSMKEILDESIGILVSSFEEAVEKFGLIYKIKRSDCRKYVERKFTSQRMVSEYIEVYKRILNSNQGGMIQ
ncbi:MAG TPA: glycosyltransferase family 4 protein [Thermodesulfobium narugense]|uniref:Mannose-6-phosphate isomerase, type 2 n=1 Tax=Thermodesulfobium acidiphilum TaxID=1794699 RepID=A0A2R4VYV7_THEAF|nr:glycosyltransferase family 4 protein [Thermodesulfobium acidiphilum]AWB09626.1 mannose-6-phosphate isomerase, type 2 [Thermodesulfobium acidiphilum]PMP85544.1 MAG: glycosyl transferase [Thermodesulfobium narugense]HEM56548.1 glycosyltransferase family 4 protein [Thermodesulfobium narugense]